MPDSKETTILEIPIGPEQLGWLALLVREHGSGSLPEFVGSDTEKAKAVILYVVAALVDGMRRPNAWEREVVLRLFGSDWTADTEKDPASSWRVQRKVR